MDLTVLDRCFELEIHADAFDVREASAWLEKTGIETKVPADQIFRLDMCLNEALANIIEHGGPAAKSSPVNLTFLPHTDEASLFVTDSGNAFNPLDAIPKAVPDSLADAEPGGLGLGLIKTFTDAVSYKYDQGRNCLGFTVRWYSSPDDSGAS